MPDFINKLNEGYFEKYCDVAYLLLNRPDKTNPAMKSIIRHVIREAINHSSDLPGYDNKKGASIASLQAIKQIETGNIIGLVGEHVVPVSVVNERLINLQNPTKEVIAETIRSFNLRAIITESEDKTLKMAGLSKKMPVNWDTTNVMYRYEFVGIKTVPYRFDQRNIDI